MTTKVVNVIKESARKHGFADEEIQHALDNAIRVWPMDDFQMVIGPTPTAVLIEVGVNQDGDVFHAMQARKKFL